MLCALGLVVGHGALADSYNVSATVPYDTPTIPATIDNPADGYVSSVKTVLVSGTCQQVFPTSIVAIERAGQRIGSTACTNANTFQVGVDLAVGVNSLTARTMNSNELYGPDSSPVSITFTPPPTPPIPPIVQEDASSDLTITTDKPFAVIAPGVRTITITVGIDGGASPYSIEINWGDGSTETKQVSAAGSYTFSHEYAKPAIYQAKATVTDVLGVSRQNFFAIVVSGELDQQNGKTPNSPASTATIKEGSTYHWYDFWWLILLSLLLFFIGLLIGKRMSNQQVIGSEAKKRKRK